MYPVILKLEKNKEKAVFLNLGYGVNFVFLLTLLIEIHTVIVFIKHKRNNHMFFIRFSYSSVGLLTKLTAKITSSVMFYFL